ASTAERVKSVAVHAKITCKTKSRLLLPFLFNRLLLNAVVFLQADGVLQLLADTYERPLVHSGSARLFKTFEKLPHTLVDHRDRADGIVHHLVAHPFQVPNRENWPAQPVALAIYEDQRRPHGCRCLAS